MRELPPYRRLRSRLSAAVCGLVGLSLACGVLSAPARADSAAAPARDTKPTGSVSGAKAEAEQSAAQRAQSTGRPVPVPESTTETDTVTAQPDGSLTLKRTIEPSRTKKTGTWVDLDPTLRPSADGRIRPASTTGDLALGGGGGHLLASMTNQGRTLSFSWPTPLPAPVLEGAGALYPNVLPDVDLKVTVTEQGGFSHTLVVKNAQAAQNPKLATVELGTALDGVALTEDAATGALSAKTPEGTVLFAAPTPRMWDSRITPATPPPARGGGSAAAPRQGTDATGATSVANTVPDPPADIPASDLLSSSKGPGVHAKTANLDAGVAAGSLTLRADTALLAAPDTQFPVYIDPSWASVRNTAGMWNWVWEAYPNTSGRSMDTYAPGVGYQGWEPKKGKERTFYNVPLGLTGDVQIRAATFYATQVDSSSFSCANTSTFPVHLHRVSDNLTANTTWSNQPSDWGRWSTVQVPSSSVKSKCGNRLVDFDIRSQVAQDPSQRILTFGLYGNESDRNAFKRFSKIPSETFITVEYNTPPHRPSDLRMSPVPVNGIDNVDCGYLGAVNPTAGGVRFFARIRDPQGTSVNAQFHLRDRTAGGDTLVWDSGWVSWGANDHEASANVPAGVIQGGRTYRWSVHAGDGQLMSPWVDGCTFSVDTTPPTIIDVTSSDFPAKRDGSTGKKAGERGTFYVNASDGESGMDTVKYSLNSTIPVGGGTSATRDPHNGRWRIDDLFVQTWGTHTLYVQAVDRAGNLSQQKAYTFYAPANPNATTTLGDITGDGRVDLLTTDAAGALRMYGTDADPAAGGQLAAGAAEGPGGTPGNRTWNGVLTTHRGGNGITYDDLFAHHGTEMYLYRSSMGPANALPRPGLPQNGEQWFVAGNRLSASRPHSFFCKDPTGTGGCTGYAADWGQVRQILAPGDVNADGRLDLLTVEDDGSAAGRLWLFTGSTATGQFTTAHFLGRGDWLHHELLSPGDVTGDERPDLWARDKRDGRLHQYASRKKADGSVDLVALADGAARTLLASGLDASTYPRLNSDGDLDGDRKGDLWTQAADGRIYVFYSKEPGADHNRFGPARLIADNILGWNVCKPFRSAADPGVSHDICGPILAKYEALGGPSGPLRLPTTPTRVTADGTGRYADFQGSRNDGQTNGAINWSATTGAWFMHGGIREKWLASGAMNGPLGYPTSDETVILDPGTNNTIGWTTRFAGADHAGGSITFAHNTAAAITGPIHSRWQAMGGARGIMGFPTTDVRPTTLKPGSYANFRTKDATHDTGAIYHSHTTGAWPVRGANFGQYATQGYEGGRLGFPTSDEYPVSAGVRGDYEGGYIRWNETTGISTVHNWQDSTQARRTELSGDVNADRRADLITVYDYGHHTAGFWVSRAQPDGSFAAPYRAWHTTPGWWDANAAKYVTGDFNGDKRDDLGAFYGYPDGRVALFTFLAQPDGTFNDGTRSRQIAPGNWDWSRTTLLAGDHNGDGRDDISAAYDYGNGAAGYFTFPAKPDGTFDIEFRSFRVPAGYWYTDRVKYATGDYNGDGRHDISALYNHNDGRVGLFTYLAQPDGGFANGTQSWIAAPGMWDWNRVRLTSGDYNGGGRDDLAALYDYGNSSAALFTFISKPDGGFEPDLRSWNVPAHHWDTANSKPVSGDYDGNGRDDIATMYNYPNGSTTAFTFRSRPDGGFDASVPSWNSPPGTW
ncbi:FG-GAP-like repeat-containing protein [Streptomyces sp. NPDC057638]|uniref:FG-GAP-like repeat-containing protein n=1 Tax=Streptomyces sp. NPDC057638 TaxID=3346190 RepID=UPI0036D07773